MAYAERRERKIGVRFRGIYKAADGSYRSAGTFDTEERALEVALEAEKHAAVTGSAAGKLDRAPARRGRLRSTLPCSCGIIRSRGTPRTRTRTRCGCMFCRFSAGVGWRRRTGRWRGTTSRRWSRRAVGEHDPAGEGGARGDVRDGGGGSVPGLQPVP